MTDRSFAPLDRAVADLADQLTPRGRRKLAGAIGRQIQTRAIRRLKRNVDAEGDAFEKRKADGGRMFQQAASRRFLQRKVSAEGARIGFYGAAGRIMNVHQHGLRDRVSEEPGAPEATYPEREVLGLSGEDRDRILDLATRALTD